MTGHLERSTAADAKEGRTGRPGMEYYARFAREGLANGQIADDLDETTIAGLVQGLIYGMAALAGVSRSFGPTDPLIDAFARAIEGTVFVDS